MAIDIPLNLVLYLQADLRRIMDVLKTVGPLTAS